MEKDYNEIFWNSYAENHFWRLNDRAKVKENSFYYDGLYDKLMPNDKQSKILDIGCGGGHFLYYLIRKGYQNILGIDLSRGLVEFVKKEISPNIINGDALQYLLEHQNEFDLLVANDFIEHLDKKRIITFLFRCHDALKVGGRLILKTPNMSNLFASRHRYVDFTHEIGFTEYSIYEICSAASFKKIQVLSEFHAQKEPKIFKLVRKAYCWLREQPPKIMSTNLIVVCEK